MKKKTRLIVIAVCVAVVLAAIIAVNNVPLGMLSSLDTPEGIDRLYVEVDPGEQGESVLVTVTDSGEIAEISGYLSGARLAYRGPYSGIQYDDGYIVAIRINGPEESVFLTADGSFYIENSRFHCVGSQASDLYAYLVGTYLTE